MRCDAHDLAAGPDGRCALCRRDDEAEVASSSLVRALLGIGLLLGCGVVYRAVTWTATALASGPRGAAVAAEHAGSDPAFDGPRVLVYTTSWCPTCKLAKKWLTAQGIGFEEHDVEASREDARKMHALNPRGSVPTFDVDGQVLVGFSESSLRGAIDGAAARRSSHAP